MSLLKRHVGRRVAGVGIGVALLMLGLEAPAFAAPAITGISPNSGPLACVVAVTGSGFDQPGAFAVDTVNFTGVGGINTEVADFHVVSDTEIWTTVPAAATTGAITVTDGNGDSDNSPVFTVTTTAGGCAPAIASFAPTCGVVGTVVTITGTNLLKSSGNDAGTPATDPAGGDVRFNPYGSTAIHTGAAESPTTLSVNVPANAVDGPIRVTTFTAPDSTVTSTDSFNVVTDPAECGPVVTTHARGITLALKKHLVAKGTVSLSDSADTLTACFAGVPVKIQRRKSGHWKNVGTTTTNDNGVYKRRIKDKPGKYRALAPKVSLNDGADLCLKAKSPTRKNT